MNGYGKIWGLFGAANQLLAGIGLLAVATWLGNMGKNNKMFLIPMAFMIIVTITSLALTVKNQIGMIAAGGADWGSVGTDDPRNPSDLPGDHPCY